MCTLCLHTRHFEQSGFEVKWKSLKRIRFCVLIRLMMPQLYFWLRIIKSHGDKVFFATLFVYVSFARI